jgi:hypothetical protein
MTGIIETLIFGAMICGAGYFWYKFLGRKDEVKKQEADKELEKLRLQKEILELTRKS